MRRVVLFILIFCWFGVQPGKAHAAAIHVPISAAPAALGKPDPCGFRYAIWPVIQETANFVNDVTSNSTDDYHANLRDNYLSTKLIDIAYNYNRPTNWKKLLHAQDAVLVDLYSVLSLDLDQNNSADSDIAKARTAQATLWNIAASFCPWKGKSQTWTGWLDAFGYQSGSTAWVHVPSGFTVNWDYFCPPSSYGGSETDPGNFIVDIHGGAYDGLGVANALDKSGYGSRHFSRGGTYSFQVITECSWQVQVTR
jgi:hypothetical protein